MKINFLNDYSEIGHPKILEKLLKDAKQKHVGYATDEVTKELEKKFQELTKCNVKLHIVAAGTPTNMILISKALKNYEAVICAESGHINVHETGAIEGSGHKVLYVPSSDGKITIDKIKYVLDTHPNFHMVKPRMVYISNTTELGTVYKLQELVELYSFCKKNSLYLYIDGARLAYALASKDADYSLKEIAMNCDAFYFGGTKCGLPYGEALLIKDEELDYEFQYHLKNKGGILAKSFVVSKMFLELLDNSFYLELCSHAIKCADMICSELEDLKIVLEKTNSNQIFIKVKNEVVANLEKKYLFEFWEIGKEETTIRLVTSWNTSWDDCHEIIKDVKTLYKSLS